MDRKQRRIEFWDQESVDALSFTDKDDAIEYILDGTNRMTGTLEICGYAQVEALKAEIFAESILKVVLENLDCNYELGNPNEATNPTKNMKEAALIFAENILEEYAPMACEIIKKETIDVNKWIRKNRPDWLEECNG